MFGLFLLTGYGSMNEFLNKRGRSDTDLCGCGRVENVWHIVFECGLYDEERKSCEWPGWIGEEEKRFERLLKSKEMYERLMRFVERVFKKRRRMREGVKE
ncbi:hypothetical protein Zmor_027966 [Zophobas morio]|uniref:Uncharacterized protein n=1 Tax=Zophobas morio TaxID=2755281 RepID=A0AA38HUN1_9CUCU|nr:hypothetical protein Zmor_027966 [Zophobas morio]